MTSTSMSSHVQSGETLSNEQCKSLPVSSNLHIPTCSSRRRHLGDLELCIRRSEGSMAALLRTFDLDSSGDSFLDEPVVDDIYFLDHRDSVQDPAARRLWEDPESDESLDCTSEPQAKIKLQSPYNEKLFISTPKHLPRLTRRGLQRILQSPSLHPETSEDLDISDLSLSGILDKTSAKSSLPGKCVVKKPENAIPSNFLPTPPLTAQLGDSERFSPVVRFRSNSGIQTSPLLFNVPSFASTTRERHAIATVDNDVLFHKLSLSTASDNRQDAADFSHSRSSYAISSTESSAQFTIQRGHRAVQHTGTILLPSVLRDLHKVLHETTTENFPTEEVFQTACYDCQDVCSHCTSLSSGLAMQNGSAPNKRSIETLSPFKHLQYATLEEEFRELLLRQAAGDSALAKDLLGLALRLDHLSESRRRLADQVCMKTRRS